MKSSVLNRIIFILCILLFQSSAALANTEIDGLFQQGNEAYSRGDYQAAISNYEQITENAGYSPSVLFNLANSYAQSGEIGRAVLTYERALRLSPSDPDINGNLELVKKERGLFPKEPSRTEQFFSLLTLKQWSALILLSLAVLTIFQLISLTYRFSKQTTISVMSIWSLALCLATAGTIFQYRYFNPSVVISENVRLLVSPFTSANSIGAVQEGRLVYPQSQHGDFVYVTDETDRKGWIPAASIEAVRKTVPLDTIFMKNAG